MPPMVLATILGMAAVLAGSTAISPLIIGHSWMLPVFEVVAVVWLIGVGGRLLTVPASITMPLQFAGVIVTATSLFLTSGIAGVIPGPAALGEARTMLGEAWDQVLTTVPPADSTQSLEFMLTLLLGVVALLVDVLVAGTRTPALVALPLLSLYSVPASIASDLLPWYTFVAPAACFAALLAVASRQEKRHARGAITVPGVVGGTALAAVAIVGALVLADSVTGIGTEGRIPHNGHGGDVGVSPWALLRGDLNTSHPVDTLTVSGLDQPAYLRTFSLDKWEPDKGFVLGSVRADHTDVSGTLPGAPTVDSRSTTITITPEHYRAKYLPIYLDTTSLSGMDQSWNYDSNLETVFRSTPVTPGPYTVVANIGAVSAAQLRTEDVRATGALTDSDGVPPQVVRLARSLTTQTTTPFDSVQAILDYFTDPASGFTYSLKTPPGNSGSALVDFLTSKQGYCEQYAAAMAIMLRTIGIPARVGIGFTQGTRQADGSYQITSTNAHAWVEVKFAKSGWVSFDPTPPTGGQGGLQGFDQSAGPAGPDATNAPEESTTASPSVTTSAPASESASSDAPIPNQGQLIPDTKQAQPGAPGSDSGDNGWSTWMARGLIGLAVIVVVLGLIAAPALLRHRRRRRRLAVAAQGSGGAGSAAWSEIKDSMVDHGLELDPAVSARETANQLARTTHLSTSDRGHLRAVVVAAEREWYAGSSSGSGPERSTATTPTTHDGDLSRGVHAVIAALRRTAPVGLGRWLLPRSLRDSATR